jgi:pimeloyl-ACP methyl ester carboxylesterase
MLKNVGVAAVLAACVVLLALGMPVRAQDAGDLEYDECPFDAPSNIDCAFLYVPENRDDPDSPFIELMIAILRADTDDPASDPVIYLEGGPGGSAVMGWESWVDNRILQTRDLILIDQRGTGYSLPSLDCYEVYDDDSDNPLQDCYDRIIDEGINPSAYNTIASAQDVIDLMQVLRNSNDYDTYNVYGISYGTRLALTVMRLTPPDLIRSVVLDSVYPPEVNAYEQDSITTINAFTTLFEGCAADAACDDAYPDLEDVFYDTVERLNDEPLAYDATDPNTGDTYESEVYGDDLASAIFSLLYDTDSIPYLPGMIWQLSEGDATWYDELMNQNTYPGGARVVRPRQDQDEDEAFLDGDSEGMNQSLECAEEAPFNDLQVALESAAQVPPALRDFQANYIESVYADCEIWQVEPMPQIETERVTSDLPTLVLAGEYDPVTPPTWAVSATKGLSNSYYYEFIGMGHGVSLQRCPERIMLTFLDDPTLQPQDNCIRRLDPPRFVLP